LLFLNGNDNGTVEMSYVRLILSPAVICGGANCAAKHDFCCKSERELLFTCV